MTDETLSNKIYNKDVAFSKEDELLRVEDVKEFIKKLKDGIQEIHTPTGRYVLNEGSIDVFHEFIDKLAGDDLIK